MGTVDKDTVSAETWERMVNFIEVSRHIVAPPPSYQERAREIYDLLVPPIDPDILAAREWLKTQPCMDGRPSIDEGKHDDAPAVLGYVAGLKAGRSE